jgi:8-oxo-dGTP pyrophosphatase MutT (NUDIX family)
LTSNRGSRLPHRIAGGAIVVRDDRILLVRYRDAAGGTFLAAPGGGALEQESVADAAVRETFEETGVRVVPGHALLIEDILTDRFKMCKIWFACTVVAGEVTITEGARLADIIECRWFHRSELGRETVYPWIVTERAWPPFFAAHCALEISPTRRAAF